MSRHEGISCDSCFAGNFRGRRYKCLVCEDFDLCANCHEREVTEGEHTPQHPMQCLLTKRDFELFFGNDTYAHALTHTAYTCPYCGDCGFTEEGLTKHVTMDHQDVDLPAICPVCVGIQGGEFTLISDFHSHLKAEHKATGKEFIAIFDEPPPRTRRINGRTMPNRTRRLLCPAASSPQNTPDPLSDLICQLSVGRRMTSEIPANQPRPRNPPLQLQLQLEKHLDKQQKAVTKISEKIGKKSLNMERDSTSEISQELAAETKGELLLETILNGEKSEIELEMEEETRADRAVFARNMAHNLFIEGSLENLLEDLEKSK